MADIEDDDLYTAADFRAAIEERDRRIAELEGENEWQPVETAPKKGEFLALNEGRGRVFQVFRAGAIAVEEPGYLAVVEPLSGLLFYTRVWCPLPTPPQEIATTEGNGHG